MSKFDDSGWTDGERALWQRLAAHPFECADAGLDFTAKLAREQGWSREEARAAVQEYRKFCFLAVSAGHAVTPSEEVDQVWHLHLTYTRDYWDVFCPQVLGMRLHHEGTDGQRDTRARHRNDYADTLASYQRWFGAPPERFWPGSAARFAAATHRWVNRQSYWLIAKPHWPCFDWRRFAAAVAALFAVGTAQALPLNPLDWGGPAFIGLYLLLLVAAFVAAKLWRSALSDNGRSDGGSGLDALQVAWLAGGQRRAVDAGVAELMSTGALRWEDKEPVRGENDAPSGPLSQLRNAVLAQAKAKKPQPTLFAKALDSVRKSLEQRGLLLDAADERRARLLPALLPALVLALGIAKIVVGLSRDRPIGFLGFLCVITFLVVLGFARASVDRSRAGERALAQLRERHAHATRAPREQDIALAVALAGTAVMAGTAYAAYHDTRAAASSSSSCGTGCSSTTTSSSSCSSSDSGGSSCSSGCGGCGGGGD